MEGRAGGTDGQRTEARQNQGLAPAPKGAKEAQASCSWLPGQGHKGVTSFGYLLSSPAQPWWPRRNIYLPTAAVEARAGALAPPTPAGA